MMDDREELEDEDANMNYRESTTQMNDQDDDNGENAQDLLAAAGLEDSDVEDEVVTFLQSFLYWHLTSYFKIYLHFVNACGFF